MEVCRSVLFGYVRNRKFFCSERSVLIGFGKNFVPNFRKPFPKDRGYSEIIRNSCSTSAKNLFLRKCYDGEILTKTNRISRNKLKITFEHLAKFISHINIKIKDKNLKCIKQLFIIIIIIIIEINAYRSLMRFLAQC